MAPTVYWSSLSYELIRRVADTFLRTNGIDYYMNLCAVCYDWRNNTDDPCTMLLDPRFRPRGWVLLEPPDEDSNGISCRCTFVNIDIDGFLTKELLIPGFSECIGSSSDVLLAFEELININRRVTLFVVNPFTLSMIGRLIETTYDPQQARA